MEIQYQKKLSDYQWLVMFDLASHKTGVCLWDISGSYPLQTYVINVKGENGSISLELWEALDSFFNSLYSQGYRKEGILVYRELAPYQQGSYTTAKTLVALGKAHAILDLYIDKNNLATYDYGGVAPATTHAYYKRLLGLDRTAKVTKQDVKNYLFTLYKLRPDITDDESDAAFLAKTFVEHYWDKSLDEHEKDLRRHKRELKVQFAKEKVQKELDFLETLRV